MNILNQNSPVFENISQYEGVFTKNIFDLHISRKLVLCD